MKTLTRLRDYYCFYSERNKELNNSNINVRGNHLADASFSFISSEFNFFHIPHLFAKYIKSPTTKIQRSATLQRQFELLETMCPEKDLRSRYAQVIKCQP